ncbi:glutamine synthetase [Exilibacterium tricleocarpae]|uniref:Glutamine synthetase n=1 Tax=Exilibacterium tricleocarpae TaxID=2591008 RepID=A0A545T8G1_9GAMM|nr:glutamine synthetase family protein [Exilibacterium tricleocarpae]TQV73513.1 glutamine synthetase [Exilibacterium tricleocarpae]
MEKDSIDMTKTLENTQAAETPTRTSLPDWLNQRDIDEVECVAADAAGIARGKVLPADKFVQAVSDDHLRIAESLFSQDVQGRTIDAGVVAVQEPDINLQPDLSTLRVLPWRQGRVASVICDAREDNGEASDLVPRQALRTVIEHFAALGFKATVAPEFEFYIAELHSDPNLPLARPILSNGARESGQQSYGVDILQEYAGLIDSIYAYGKALGVNIDVLTHEAGPGQFEINLKHGDPLAAADQTFMFKRLARAAAAEHGKTITFMAKPVADQPGNAMHIHQSVYAIETGDNVFVDAEGRNHDNLYHYIGGLQKYIPALLPMFAPFINSYRRFVRNAFAPVTTHWGYENRTVGLRIPASEPANRRVENRVIGADANPYLAIAATLACGLLGMRQRLSPSREMTGSAYAAKSLFLPEDLLSALGNMKKCKALGDVFSPRFLTLYWELKYAEYKDFMATITPWEREHLLTQI